VERSDGWRRSRPIDVGPGMDSLNAEALVPLVLDVFLNGRHS
jgi:hypothetical protein